MTTLGLGVKGEMNSQVRKNQVAFYVAIAWMQRKVIGLRPKFLATRCAIAL